jgi:hypothetical protein
MSKYNGLYENKKEFEEHRNNNCYTYAINQPFNPYTNEPYSEYIQCQPGYLGGKGETPESTIFDKRIIDLARKDLKLLGYELVESTLEEYIDEEVCWKVAFCYDDSCDYHWYRQNFNGTWSHKIGTKPVKNIDEDDNIISNPEKCNRGVYKNFVGYYIIKRIINEVS